ncbi:hypothetical protein [Streptomyces sp. CB03911]|uniref:hypothetical protein n=1 Tax=Streptomyces sp. CB03911 TaxID=1804758 RepID=UPI0018FE81EC|nr:hypothetical protein [Streptomyces sp. CB03911]
MSSDWVTAAFTLAGSGLTGALALAGTRAQRWQTRVQMRAADKHRVDDMRKDCYVRFLNAAAAFQTTWWHRLDQPDKEETRDQLVVCWTHLEQETAAVQITGPLSVSRKAMSVAQALMKLDDLSDACLREMIRSPEAREPLRQLRGEVKAQRRLSGAALEEFAVAAQAALGLQ